MILLRSLLSLSGIILVTVHATFAQTLPVFVPGDVRDTFFGTVVSDPYRGLESVSDPKVSEWMKAHADHARRTLDSLPGYAPLKMRIAELENAATATIGTVQRTADGSLFFTRRSATDNTFKLYHRGPGGQETRLVDPDDWEKQTGKSHAINYFEPSPDGRLVAFGVSASGSEDASLYVLETASGKRIGEPITRARGAEVNWRPDSKSFFYFREQELLPGMPATERYRNGRGWLHTVGSAASADVAVSGPGVSARIAVDPNEFALLFVDPGSRYALTILHPRLQNAPVAVYAAPLESVGKPDTPWIRVCDRSDKIIDWAVHGDDIFLLTYRDSPRFSIIRTTLAAPDVKGATVVVAASDQVVRGIAAGKDALYIESRDGAVKRIKRLPWGAAAPTDVKLPIEGAATLMNVRPDVAGAIIGLAAWTRGRQIHAIDATGNVANTGLQPLGPFDAPTDLVVEEVKVKSHDGAMVPLSIIHKRDIKLDGSNPTLLYGYGSYGVTEDPGFFVLRLAWLERGGVYAVANVRGSGVYGEDWYKAGYRTTKPNTWKDFIACAEYLIAQKYTIPAKLGILGFSAGGILIGRAMTERPDLFVAAVPAVGLLDMVRAETTANGVPNIPEFGTVKNEDEFRGLLAMSSYHHVRDQTAYPAVLLTHGVNDPRVNVWHSSKMAARLMAATTSAKPILLDLDYDAGHGIGSTKSQRQRQIADIYAFLLWQMGSPEFQPK